MKRAPDVIVTTQGLPRAMNRAGRTLSMAANFIAVFVLVFTVGPAIEARFFRIVANQQIDNVQRDASQLCWRWSFDKVRRPSSLVEADLKIETPDGDMVDAAALIKEPHGVLRYVRALRTSPGDGKRHHRILCADLDRAQISPGMPITVHLTMIYETWTPWRIPQRAPDFKVAPIPLLPPE